MSQSERSALLLKVIEVALGALGPLAPSREALRFEREADALRATVESWRETPPDFDARRATMQRVLRLHSEATKFSRQEVTPQATPVAVDDPPASRPERADAAGEGDRPTPPAPFSMEAFAWDMTAPESEHRPPSAPPPQWQARMTEPFALDVEVDGALAGWDGRRTSPGPQPSGKARSVSPSSIERAVVSLIEDSAAPLLTRREIEDPAAYILERYGVGDFEGALDMTDIVLAESPGDLLVRQCRDKCREALAKVYAQKLGPLDRIPVVVTLSGPSDALSGDHRMGFLLSLIDGTSSVEAILDACGMPRLDALRLLHQLAQRGVIAFE